MKYPRRLKDTEELVETIPYVTIDPAFDNSVDPYPQGLLSLDQVRAGILDKPPPREKKKGNK